MICYHVTPAENLDSIARQGLRPMIGPRSADMGEAAPAIYLFRDADALLVALESWLETAFDLEDPLACLVADLSGLEISDVPAMFEVTCRDIIPPDRLRLLTWDIWEEVRIPDIRTATPLEEDLPEP